MRSPFATVLATVLLFLGSIAAAPGAGLDKRQWDESKFCKPGGLCYLQIVIHGTNPLFRIAIPEGASGSFDTVLEMVTPTSLGWTGFAWGGGMTLNPLTVVWPNGNSATISSRWASGRTMPGMYSGATYKLLSASKNSTHWTTEVACTGCSKWSGGQLRPDALNTFAWAVSRTTVPQPASSSSSFQEHTNVGMFTSQLTSAKNSASAFQQHVRGS